MNFIKNLKIGTRLTISFAVLLVFLVVLTALGMFASHQINQKLERVYKERAAPTAKLAEVNYMMQRNRVLLTDMMVQNDPISLTVNSTEMQTNIEDIGNLWVEYVAHNMSAAESEASKVLWTELDQYSKEGLLPTVDAIRAGDMEGAKAIYRDKLIGYANAAQGDMNALMQQLVEESKKDYESAQALKKGVDIAMLAASAVALALGALLSYAITQSIVKPLRQSVELANTVASGDLTSHVKAIGRDETAQLLQALQAMNDSLVRVVGEVRHTSDSIATGSAEIAHGNADLSSRTEAQASNLEQTAASMEELTATVNQNTATARQASQLSAVAREAAHEGGQVVGEVVKTMAEITTSSRKISDIIGVIDGIAFQTNILALNAAVEAARAGEQGRGFAVVAGEVRTLAQRSAQAAKEIKELIETSVQSVEAGSQLVGRAGSSMDNIVMQVQRVSDLIGEITAASEEQSNGIAQVGSAVAQLDQVTQQNAALVEQSAAAAESLKTQAAHLAGVVSAFKLSAQDEYAHGADEESPADSRALLGYAAA